MCANQAGQESVKLEPINEPYAASFTATTESHSPDDALAHQSIKAAARQRAVSGGGGNTQPARLNVRGGLGNFVVEHWAES